MLDDLRIKYGSVREQQGRIYVLKAHSPADDLLRLVAEDIPDAFVTHEKSLTVPGGKRLGPRFALWVPAPKPSPLASPSSIQPILNPPVMSPPPAPPAPVIPPEVPAQPAPQEAAPAETAKPRRSRSGKSTKYKNITRIDHPAKHTFGYFVRVRWQGVQHQKFFSDKQHGDRLGALDAAIAWRNKTEAEIGKPRTERLVLGPTSKDTGIRRIRQGHTDYYEATWMTYEGKQRRTKYSIAKHGERKARSLARKARQQGERERWRTPAAPE